MIRTLSFTAAALCFCYVPLLSAQPQVEETWEGLSAGADVMKSGRWTMAQGLPSEMRLVAAPGGGPLVLQTVATAGGAPIAVSVERFVLDAPGIDFSVRFLQSPEISEDEQLQFGFRGADSGGAPLSDSYRVRVAHDMIYLNRFPRVHKGKQQIVGRYALPGGFREEGVERVVTLRVKGIAPQEVLLEVLVDGAPAFRVTSRTGEAEGLPAQGSAVRAFFLSGPGTFIREIKVEPTR